MKLYLDDDSTHPTLTRLLLRAGHDVQLPADVGLSGTDDAVHLRQAVIGGRALLSRNHDDFRNLHELVAACAGAHPGILMIRQDNDPNRDMSPRAIEKLTTASATVHNQFVILNQWR